MRGPSADRSKRGTGRPSAPIASRFEVRSGIGADGPIPARIRVVEDLGSEAFVHLVVDHDGEERRIVAKVDPPFAGEPGENVRLTLRGAVHLFDATEVRRATVTL